MPVLWLCFNLPDDKDWGDDEFDVCLRSPWVSCD